MIEPLRMGVVGLGIRGFHLAHLITRIQETELVAMADMQDKMLDIAREKFPGVELYESGAAMAEKADIEAVLVATGDRFHAGNACEALENGKHVLIEKPMAQTFDDIIQIAQLQKQTGLTVGMFLEMRLNGIWQRAKAIIEAGELGERAGRDLRRLTGGSRGARQGPVLCPPTHALPRRGGKPAATKGRSQPRPAQLVHGRQSAPRRRRRRVVLFRRGSAR